MENLKMCGKCGETLPLSEFYQKTKTRKQSYCKPCFSRYCMERWKQKKRHFIEALGGSCEDCRGVFHRAVYDFHHTESKDFDWSKLRLRSNSTIERELAKCVLLCANCHRLRHADES